MRRMSVVLTYISLLSLLLVSIGFVFSGAARADVWTQVNANGFGDAGNTEYSCMAVFNGNLYVGVGNYYTTTGCEVWRYDGSSWTQVSTDGFGNPKNLRVLSMCVFNGNLYVGAYNYDPGCEVWRYDGSTWTKVNANGFGESCTYAPQSLAVFNGNLYVGTGNAEPKSAEAD